ncbi:MAG: hypothetical protein QM607_07195, partial [Microbacterium sp.]
AQSSGRLLITSITWERVIVTFRAEFESAPEGEVDFIIYDMLRGFPVDVTKVTDAVFEIRINVTNFRERHQMSNGTWRFMAAIDGKRGPIASYPLARASELQPSSRTFLYNGNYSCYVVSFGFSEDERADLLMRTYQLNRNRPRPSKPKPKAHPSVMHVSTSESSPTQKPKTTPPSRPKTGLRKFLSAVDRTTNGASTRAFEGVDRLTGGRAVDLGHRVLHQVRRFTTNRAASSRLRREIKSSRSSTKKQVRR